jgi:hypothetical protein
MEMAKLFATGDATNRHPTCVVPLAVAVAKVDNGFALAGLITGPPGTHTGVAGALLPSAQSGNTTTGVNPRPRWRQRKRKSSTNVKRCMFIPKEGTQLKV